MDGTWSCLLTHLICVDYNYNSNEGVQRWVHKRFHTHFVSAKSTSFPKGQLGSLQASREVQSPFVSTCWHLPQPPRLPSKPLLPLPPSFFTLAAALMRAAPPIVNCVLTARRVSLQSTKLQESVQDEQSWALSIVRLLPAAAWLVRNTRNCQL